MRRIVLWPRLRFESFSGCFDLIGYSSKKVEKEIENGFWIVGRVGDVEGNGKVVCSGEDCPVCG
jgi:hypothetical protein